MRKSIKLFALMLFVSFFTCNEEPVDQVIANEDDVIQVDSEMFNLIERVAGTSADDSDITCINFVYSFTLFTYDEDLLFLTSQQISSDAEFSALLEALEDGHSISLSLPITATLESGLEISISSYEELKEAIDACVENDFLLFCNGAIPTEGSECVWEVSSLTQNGTQYNEAYFTMNSDGSVTFNFDGIEYLGTWINLIIENEVHMNINLEGNSGAASDWNFDWLLTYTPNGAFHIDNGINTFALERVCEDSCDLIFEECETIIDSGIAEFDLSSYVECILSQTDFDDPLTTTVTFHITQADAENNVAPLPVVFTNTSNPETIFVRIEDSISNEIVYISITVEATSC